MIIKPLTTEKAIRLIEMDNTILFQVDSRDNKEKIKEDVEKINVVNRGTKKIAYIKLNKKNPAIDIATKLGMI